MSFVTRLRAVAVPLERECECGGDTIQWGASTPLARVNAMRPLAAPNASLRAINEFEHAIPSTTFSGMWRKMHRALARNMDRQIQRQIYGMTEW